MQVKPEYLKIDMTMSIEDLVKEIKEAPIAELFRKVLHVQQDVEAKIEKLDKSRVKKVWPSERCISATKAVSTILCFGGILYYGPLPFWRLVCLAGVMVFGLVVIECRNIPVDTTCEVEELEKTQGHINAMLDILRRFDKHESPTVLSDLFRSLKFWYYVQDETTPKFEEFVSVLQKYLPENDPIRSHFTVITNNDSDPQEREKAWMALEHEMQTLVSFIKVNDVVLAKPGNHVKAELASKGKPYYQINQDKLSVVKFS